MAGQHQLWVYDPAGETIRLFAGSGREELRDGPLLQGGLNQPSGLATDGRLLYFADSEASAIRSADLDPAGALATIVGTGLFDFGDVDGVGDAVRLQHPLAVAYQDGLLYVADTYNSKIKTVDPAARRVQTLFGGPAGWQDGPEPRFDEPGGLSVAGDRLYIADTNNHAVRVADLATGEVTTLVLVDVDGLLTRLPAGEAYTGKVVTLDRAVAGAGTGMIALAVEVPAGYKINDLAPFSMAWQADGQVISLDTATADQRLVSPTFPLTVPASFSEGEATLTVDLVIYYCEAGAESLCFIEQVRLVVPVAVAGDGPANLRLTYDVPPPPVP